MRPSERYVREDEQGLDQLLDRLLAVETRHRGEGIVDRQQPLGRGDVFVSLATDLRATRTASGRTVIEDDALAPRGVCDRADDVALSLELFRADAFVSVSLMGTYLLENSFSNRAIEYDCAGYYGNQCGQPHARWRHRVRASWQTKFDTAISLGWRFIGSATIDDASPDSDLADPDLMESWWINGADVVRAYNYLDFAATYTFRKGLQVTVGVNDLLDTEPPLAPGLADNEYGRASTARTTPSAAPSTRAFDSISDASPPPR